MPLALLVSWLVVAAWAVDAPLADPLSSYRTSATIPPARPPQTIATRAIGSMRFMVAMLVAAIRPRNRPCERSRAPGPVGREDDQRVIRIVIRRGRASVRADGTGRRRGDVVLGGGRPTRLRARRRARASGRAARARATRSGARARA